MSSSSSEFAFEFELEWGFDFDFVLVVSSAGWEGFGLVAGSSGVGLCVGAVPDGVSFSSTTSETKADERGGGK